MICLGVGEFVQAKKLAIVALLVAGLAGVSYGWFATHVASGAQPWKSGNLTATYISTELRQLDPANASLFLYYEIENRTDSDYRLGTAPGLVIMSRLRSGGSLSSQEDVRFSFPAFIPARQRARVALEMRHALAWPGDNDPARQDKLRDFVNQRLESVNEFVLFDPSDRTQIEFPRGWQELQMAAVAAK